MAESFSVKTPIVPNSKLSMNISPNSAGDLEIMRHIPYQSAMGSIVYAMVCTRPDIAQAVGVVSQFVVNPRHPHWTDVKQIFCYLKGTIDHGLCFTRSINNGGQDNLKLVGFCDSNWTGDIDSRRSTTGYLFLMPNGCISWNSKRQSTIALSFTKVEYMAATQAIKEAIWLCRLMKDMDYPQTRPTVLFGDNQGCISLTKNPIYHARTKHIEIHHHFVSEKVDTGEIEMVYCPTTEMTTDVLSKGPTQVKHDQFKAGMGVVQILAG